MSYKLLSFILVLFFSLGLFSATVDLTDLSDFNDQYAEADNEEGNTELDGGSDSEPDKAVETSVVNSAADASATIGNAGAQEALSFLGLKPNAWNKTSRDDIYYFLKKLPTKTEHKFLMRLVRAFLLAPLEIPPEIGKKKNPDQGDLNLLILRAKKLYKMGFLDDAFNLLQAHRSLQAHGLYLKLKFQKDLMVNKTAEACSVAQERVQTNNTIFWQKAQAVCQALNGKGAEAQLSLSLISENQEQEEQEFSTALQMYLDPALSHYKPDESHPDLLALTLASKVPGALTKEVFLQLPVLIRFYLYSNLGEALELSDEDKLDLYEEALENSAIDVDQLRSAYLAYYQKYKERIGEDKLDFKEVATSLTSGARALLYGHAVATRHQKSLSDKFYLALVANASKANRLYPVALVLGDKTQEFIPREGEGDYIDLFALASAFLGGSQPLCAWQFYVKEATRIQTLPLIFLKCPKGDLAYQNEQIGQWFEHFQEVYKENLPDFYKYVAKVFSVLQVFNREIPKEEWKKIPLLEEACSTGCINLVDKALIERSIKDKNEAEFIARLLIFLGKSEEIWMQEGLLFVVEKLVESGNEKLAYFFANEMMSWFDAPQESTAEAEDEDELK